mmetsp:Transcript_17438/g.37655  ORF Transcript_17438/g.37655 Transcript_17438/m.37655 type:complete len:95 (-) Transcript_17438:6-290(-)
MKYPTMLLCSVRLLLRTVCQQQLRPQEKIRMRWIAIKSEHRCQTHRLDGIKKRKNRNWKTMRLRMHRRRGTFWSRKSSLQIECEKSSKGKDYIH